MIFNVFLCKSISFPCIRTKKKRTNQPNIKQILKEVETVRFYNTDNLYIYALNKIVQLTHSEYGFIGAMTSHGFMMYATTNDECHYYPVEEETFTYTSKVLCELGPMVHSGMQVCVNKLVVGVYNKLYGEYNKADKRVIRAILERISLDS